MSSRDLALGAALRSLDVPDHAPGFYARLHALLAQERLGDLGEARRRRQARQTRVRWAARAAVVAAAATFAALFFLPRDEHVSEVIGPETAAAAIQAKVAAALADARTLRGKIVVEGENAVIGSEEGEYTFAFTERGDFRLHGLTRRYEIAYDAENGVERQYFVDAEGTISAGEFTGLAPGLPDPGPSTWLLARQYGSSVRALLAARQAGVVTVKQGGRPAWRLNVKVEPNVIVPELTADRLDVTVDQQTGFPVRVIERKRGHVLSQTTIEELEVNEELPPSTFVLEFPEAASPNRIDHGYRRVELADVKTAVGYAPLVPGWVPDGYELAEVAVSRESGYPTGAEGGNPPSTDVVSLSYRRGLDQFLVTTRLTNPPGWSDGLEGELDPKDYWGNPFASEGYPHEPERVSLSHGALAGVEAELVIVPRRIPHVWALTDKLVVTVSGDLSRRDLIRIAESIEQEAGARGRS